MSLISIGELAARTGVLPTTLRSWEQRVGFPEPVRSARGQRHYRSEDAELVSRVVSERERGLSLTAAVDAVRRAPRLGAQPLSTQLRSAHPHLDVLSVGVRVMRLLTWAIEDDCLARASHPLLFGCFQNERSFEVAGARWRELARSSVAAYAFADFPHTDDGARPVRVRLAPQSSMLSEWSLVCIDDEQSVALVAWEPPRPSGAHTRRFECVLTFEPDVVRDAARRCAATAEEAGVAHVSRVVADHASAGVEDPQRTAALLRRFVAYTAR